jgi:hypothetical protein
MNRQARFGEYGRWRDYGAVTLEQAAKKFCQEYEVKGTIQVRDESEPEIIHTLTVKRVVEYRVTNLRGGA